MRKPSKTVDRAELTAAHAKIDLLERALQAAIVERPDATSTASDDGWRYHCRLYRATSATGGIVITRASTDGQRPLVEARYLDDWRAELAGSPIYRERENRTCSDFLNARTRLMDRGQE